MCLRVFLSSTEPWAHFSKLRVYLPSQPRKRHSAKFKYSTHIAEVPSILFYFPLSLLLNNTTFLDFLHVGPCCCVSAQFNCDDPCFPREVASHLNFSVPSIDARYATWNVCTHSDHCAQPSLLYVYFNVRPTSPSTTGRILGSSHATRPENCFTSILVGAHSCASCESFGSAVMPQISHSTSAVRPVLYWCLVTSRPAGEKQSWWSFEKTLAKKR